MGKGFHLDPELISAFLDGELSPAESEAARAHLSACIDCSRDLNEFRTLESALAAPAMLSCDAVLPLVSAEIDGELAPEQAGIVREHLAACDTCAASRALWSRLDARLAALGAAEPSRAVDDAVFALGRRRVPLALPRFAFGAVPRLVAAVLVLAIALAGPSLIGAPFQQAQLPEQQVVVSAAQTVVLDGRTRTVFVLEPAQGIVLVRDAATDAQIGKVDVGGHPTALAIDENASAVYVLDGSAKSLARIDTSTLQIVATVPLTLAGAPVSLQVSPESGKVVVASAGGANVTGQIAVVDASKDLTVETVKTIDVAPTFVVVDAAASRTFVLGADATLVLDTASLARVATLPGGAVGAAPDGNGVTAFLLDAKGGRSRVMFYGANADAIELQGMPLTITPGPSGSFAVLLNAGGHTRLVQLDETGVLRSQDKDFSARQLAYDAATGQLTLLGAAGDVLGTLNSSFSFLPPTPTPSTRAAQTAPQSAAPSPSSSPSASGSPVPSRSPSAVAAPAPSAPPVPSGTPPVPGARLAWSGTYFLPLGDWQPQRVVARGTAVWFVDASGAVVVIDGVSGRATKIGALPQDAKARFVAMSPDRLFVVDDEHGKLYSLDLTTGKTAVTPTSFARTITGLSVAPNGHAWLASSSSGSLIDFDPATRTFALFDTGIAKGLFGISVDTGGRVWYAYPSVFGISVGAYDPFARSVNEYGVAGIGGVDNVFADANGTVWVSSPQGQWAAIANGKLVASFAGAAATLQRFAIGPDGSAWLLRAVFSESRVGPASATLGNAYPGGISDLASDGNGTVWLAAPAQNGFYLLSPTQVTQP